jgi:hypothetical protein
MPRVDYAANIWSSLSDLPCESVREFGGRRHITDVGKPYPRAPLEAVPACNFFLAPRRNYSFIDCGTQREHYRTPNCLITLFIEIAQVPIEHPTKYPLQITISSVMRIAAPSAELGGHACGKRISDTHPLLNASTKKRWARRIAYDANFGCTAREALEHASLKLRAKSKQFVQRSVPIYFRKNLTAAKCGKRVIAAAGIHE